MYLVRYLLAGPAFEPGGNLLRKASHALKKGFCAFIEQKYTKIALWRGQRVGGYTVELTRRAWC